MLLLLARLAAHIRSGYQNMFVQILSVLICIGVSAMHLRVLLVRTRQSVNMLDKLVKAFIRLNVVGSLVS